MYDVYDDDMIDGVLKLDQPLFGFLYLEVISAGDSPPKEEFLGYVWAVSSCSFPLKIDNTTSIGSRPSVARVVVELDINKHYLNSVWLGPENFGYIQNVKMEEFPPSMIIDNLRSF
ncbi:hypothetical protein IEQ34_019403 [Dendrobium chrysotoxum]|uniref:Uncharacterized protein n=1 Tax=Dendrobium chrysotoxum TaxID=161865 RepID=A0AAV7G8R1_DENCH|nr:hypothetical protein IEQ34_019403 [Dendrobium chrysotoxum]